MKKQIVVINGWDSKSDYIDFEDYVKKSEFSLEFQNFTIWWRTLSENLWNEYEILTPNMPNSDFAEYKYWKMRFEQVLPYLCDDVILVGHSLWWGFLLKYLNENAFAYKIKHIFIVAWTFKDGKYLLWDFNYDKKLSNFKKYQEITTFYHSKDDHIVDFSDMLDFREELPLATYRIFENRWHFIDKKFQELEDDIINYI